MISTRTFSPDPAMYRRLALTELFRRMAWMNAFALFLFGYGLWQQRWILVAGAVLWLVGTYGYAWWRMGKTLSDPANAALLAPRSYTFRPDGFTTDMGEGATRDHLYTSLAHIARTDDHLRLYVSTDGFLIVPHSSFATDADRQQVETWLRASEGVQVVE